MMGIQKLILHQTQFIYLFRKMFSLFRVLWVSFFTLFCFTRQCLFRFQEKFKTQKKISNFELVQPKEDNQTTNGNINKVRQVHDGSRDENDESEPIFRFRFLTYEEFLRNNNNNPVLLCENLDDKVSYVDKVDDYLGSKCSKIDEMSKELSHDERVVEHEISSEIEVLPKNIINNWNSLEELLVPNTSEISLNGSVSQKDVLSVPIDEVKENSEELEVKNEEEMSEQGDDSIDHENNIKNDSEEESLVSSLENNEDVIGNKTNSHVDDEPLVSDFDSDSLAPSSESSFRSSFIDSLSDGFLSDIDFERAFDIDNSSEFGWNEMNLTKEALTKEDLELQNLWKGYEGDDCDEEDEDILLELKNLESNLEDTTLIEEYGGKTENETENKQKDEKSSSGEQLSSDSDEQNGLESQWEHQDLLEQLKMEIKKVRAIGLPTILEESESPKIMDDLKPWKIEEKYNRGGTIDELQKFYKTYKERMRKLDILNYQKMYAIGFLRLKDPLQSFTKNKISTPSLSTIVSVDCWPCKPKSITEVHEPVMKKFTKELESDLEMVYVGQMCLSWEFLRWQYGKALDLWETDPHGIHQYNEVADKFQTFQVLLTRFLEDERFEGPRVHNYVKKRCVQRNLLQIPLIRDNNTGDRRKEKKVMSSKDAITSLQLVEIIEESIRILWRFIKTDKDPNNVALLKCRRGFNKVELQNPVDADLLEEIRSNLQKKEKKLKELSRSEKCILRKIQRHQEEEGQDHVLHFFSQVDLRLVARVLNMPRLTTDQLVWCSDKLSNIHLVGKRLHIESSVLLFPCT